MRSDLWTPLKKENNVLITNRAGNRLRIEKCWLAVANQHLDTALNNKRSLVMQQLLIDLIDDTRPLGAV